MATKLNDLNEKQSISNQTKFNNLHRESEKAMNYLLNKLEPALKSNKISSIEMQLILEFYHNTFEDEFKKSSELSAEPDENKIKAIIKEVRRGDRNTYKKNAIEDGLTNFDRKAHDSIKTQPTKYKN